MTSPHHPNGSQPRPIGKYGSVSEAARKLGITRQKAKRILDPSRFQSNRSCDTMRASDRAASPEMR
jgi:hypothetical protein